MAYTPINYSIFWKSAMRTFLLRLAQKCKKCTFLEKKLPIGTAHQIFPDGRNPEVIKNPYYVLSPEGSQSKVSAHWLHYFLSHPVSWSFYNIRFTRRKHQRNKRSFWRKRSLWIYHLKYQTKVRERQMIIFKECCLLGSGWALFLWYANFLVLFTGVLQNCCFEKCLKFTWK